MDVLTAVFFVVGVAALVVGAEALVRGAARLAARTGLSSVVIGLTVVAFGTSAPELAVSLGASFRDEADLAVGNVVGSNIANVLLVLGIAAAAGGGLVVAQRIVRIDVPLMLGVSVLVVVFGWDNEIERWEGAAFVVLLVTYITWTVVSARRNDSAAIDDEYEEALSAEKLRESSAFTDVGFVLLGLVLLVVGAQALVEAATDIARALDVSELVIGLTVVAIGTSLPEIATSVVAAVRGQRDLAVGNAVGSNLFNILAVLGITAAVSPNSIPVPDGALTIDLPVMVAVAIACLPFFANGFSLLRWEGVLFLGYYAAYVVWLVLDSAEHAARNEFAVAFLGFVLPLSLITAAVIAVRDRRSKHALTPSQV
ncbi:MAG: calcium/sodium antiporter [Ilumatobacter sp.]|uniref:calcium/sodium antiporter n=1 Tax=Ilumatobacter sp. TaxID=1967498 RepID=UPI002632D5F8|nr:calcium/sodium antiporter [Ilumatobacter sp.]MDJ0771087.1 calcium/sodium antiporter [Ilumatobacter sp.]